MRLVEKNLLKNPCKNITGINLKDNSEFQIPSYLMRCADKYLSGSKRTFSAELKNLRKHERQGTISIYNFEDNFEIPKTREDFELNEDRDLLEIAKITNSIIITSDINFKDQAILAQRPVIYLNSETVSNVKVLHDTRVPYSARALT